MRDNRLRSLAIETDRYTTSTFKLTTPLDVPAAGLTGNVVEIAITGDLTLHGVTKSVSIPAQARLNADRIEVAGSITFPFGDFSIEAPNIANFVSVEDRGTLEFLVALARS